MTEGLVDRRERLRRARLYLVVEAAAEPVLGPALRGGVDMVQLRDKDAPDEEILRAAAGFRALCDEHGALFWLNDRPDLARAAGADGVHLGQDDMPVAEAREQLGPDLLIGLSTHSPEQFDAALASEADQLSVGPVWETPTKAGRPAAGLDYVRHAAEHGGDGPGSRSAGSTQATWRRSSARARGGSSSCGRSGTRRTRRPRRAHCATRCPASGRDPRRSCGSPRSDAPSSRTRPGPAARSNTPPA